MAGNARSDTLHLRLAPSPSLAAGLAAAHLGGGACVLATDPSAALQWLAAALVVLLGIRAIGLHALAGAARAIVHLTWDGDGRWRLTQRDGRMLEVALEHGSYSHPALVALALRGVDGRLHRVLVARDRIDGESFRRLRVRLRCQGAARDDDDRAALC